MTIKNCINKECKQQNPQPLENFRNNSKAKDGHESKCKDCKKVGDREYRDKNKEAIKIRSKIQRDKNPTYSKKWKEKNPEKFKANQKRYKDKNREEVREKGLNYYYKNRDRQLVLAKKRRDENPEKERAKGRKFRQENKGSINAKTAKRRAAKLKATPKSLTKNDFKKIKELYEEAEKITKETGIPHHVDHIIPLQAVEARGLHVLCNLRIIPGSENESKNNRIKQEDLEEHKKFVIEDSKKQKPSS